MESGLDWTTARPVALNNRIEIGKSVISYGIMPSPFKMSRKQLTKFMVVCTDNARLIGKAPLFSGNS